MAELFLVDKPLPPQPLAPEDDSRARAEALETTRSFIVEAPAGSGKTGLLIQRFLKLLATDSVTDPAQVLAITFTRKATVEMRDRVLAQLHAAAANTDPVKPFDRLTRPLALAALQQDRRYGWNLLDSPRRLNIRTIDSISADIAHSLPILSGSPGNLAPTEDAEPLHQEAARRTLMLLGGEDPALTAALEELLLHRDASLADCESLIASMLKWRDQWGELIPISPADLDDAWLEANVLPKLNKALDLAICRGLTRLSNALPPDVLTTLSTLASDMGHADGYKGNVSPIAVCAGKYAQPGEKSEHLAHWKALIHLLVTPSSKDYRKGFNVNHLGFMIQPEHKKQLAALIYQVRDNSELCKLLCSVNALPPATYPAEQWAITKSLFRVLSRALIELQIVFAERGQCDFAELGLLARAALRREAAVEDLSQATGLNLQHLLVDEMQDTSSSQYELIQLLTQRWDGHSQTVFLVGDPKQSIYLFRQARVERFVQTMHRETFGDLPLTALHLTTNFRSQANLVHAFNQDFSLLFPPVPEPTQPELVPYRSAQPARAAGPANARLWHTHALPFADDPAEKVQVIADQRTQDALQIRRQIEAWQARPLPLGRTEPWTIAVLVRTRTHLLEIVSALRQPSPIPFHAVQIEPLGERQEILDLLALTRALLHPADRTAWLALLRTPWCGLALADLYLLAGADDETFATHTILTLLESRGHLLSEDGIARIAPFYTIMQAALADRGRLRIAPWVERTWRSFGAPLFATPEALANAERLFSLIEQLELPGGRLDLSILKACLAELYAAPSVHPGAVDLMTIHGSKGLEWDVVFLPALERTAGTSRSRLLNWLEVDGSIDLDDDSVAHGILAPIQAKGLASQELNAWMRSIESAREAAERKRLFYVACTRAREELHLFASPSRKKDGTLAIPTNSLLASAWPAVEPTFAAAPILQLPIHPTAPEPDVLQTLAATAISQPRLIQRIPWNIVAAHQPTTATLPYGRPETPAQALFERPEGSFVSRAFGNSVHAFLEQLTLALAAGQTCQSLLEELPTWQPRILQALRANGLAPATLERIAGRVLLALRNALTDPAGRWILAPHPAAASESSLTITETATTRTIRFDRIFHAGAQPLAPGEDHRWVIDYKTATLGGRDLQLFLNEERAKYEPQILSYAHALAANPQPDPQPTCFALYYPLLPKLLCY